MKSIFSIILIFLIYVSTFGQTSRVRTSQCNTTLTNISTPIYATSVSGALAFTYKLKRSSDGLTDSLEKTSGTITAFSLADFNSSFIHYNETYEVTVKVKIGTTYGNYGVMCTITTPNLTPPTVRSTQCGITLAEIGTPIYSITASCVEGYRFLVSNGTNNTIVYPGTTPNAFALINQAGQTYGGSPSNLNWVTFNQTYQVSVSVIDNGVWSAWGVACNISTPPGSKLLASMAGKTLNYLYYEDVIAEVSTAPGLQDYQFRYRNALGSSTYTTATLSSESSENASDNIVRISDFGVVNNYGKTFRMSVRVKYNGIWSPWGTETIVYSALNPVTKLNDGLFSGVNPYDNCGNSFNDPFLMPNVNSNLWSYNLYGFSEYTFEVSKLDGSGNVLSTEFLTRSGATFGSTARGFNLTHIPNYTGLLNTTFRVRVKTNLGDYGEACFVRTPSAIVLEPITTIKDYSPNEEFEHQSSGISQIETPSHINFYPNPYTNSVSINYSDEFKGIVNVEIFDLNGKVIFSGNIELDDLMVQDFWKNETSNEFIVNISNSNKLITKRILKK